MQLLPQKKVTEQKKDEREAEIFRRLRVQRVQAAGEKEIHEITASFDLEKKKILKEFNDFKDGIEKQKSKFLGEILVLERRRDTAMEPFYELKFQALEAMDRAAEWEYKVKLLAKEVDDIRLENIELKSKLDKKEKFLSDKEKIINDSEIVLIEKEAKIVLDQKKIDSKKELFDNNFSKISSEQKIKDRELAAREFSLKAEIDWLNDQRKKLNEDKKIFEDRLNFFSVFFEDENETIVELKKKYE